MAVSAMDTKRSERGRCHTVVVLVLVAAVVIPNYYLNVLCRRYGCCVSALAM